MAKMRSLEDYLRSYFRSTHMENGPMSFATYKAESGENGKATYQRAMQEASIASALGDSGYGITKESLRQKGLSVSGYRDYLTRVGADRLAATDTALRQEMAETEEKNAQGYLAYLSSYGEEQQRIGRRVSETLISRGVINAESAYNYAVQSGLSPDMAKQVVESTYGVLRQKVIDEIMGKIAMLELDAKGAEIYARHMGLSDSDASFLGKAAEKLIDHYIDISDSYYEHLKELEELGGHVHGEFIELQK